MQGQMVHKYQQTDRQLNKETDRYTVINTMTHKQTHTETDWNIRAHTDTENSLRDAQIHKLVDEKYCSIHTDRNTQRQRERYRQTHTHEQHRWRNGRERKIPPEIHTNSNDRHIGRHKNTDSHTHIEGNTGTDEFTSLVYLLSLIDNEHANQLPRYHTTKQYISSSVGKQHLITVV